MAGETYCSVTIRPNMETTTSSAILLQQQQIKGCVGCHNKQLIGQQRTSNGKKAMAYTAIRTATQVIRSQLMTCADYEWIVSS